ncbi:hypothetical protein MTBBW1_2190019 [Desulfamplus magnetovallimortis]|uniref:Uncharacterized protein n=1 Tax=Desulfamplus magnetovallimortis TaxID=1246637 RepID=A0A1W1HCV2_9BACT|nr:hypothetical protein [Desulfamplus magnetovallimortis]SLM30299.1 hypothetical protein MTBBW1_2190019 [Desulfamplus magnetovallimortis]
MIVFVVMRFDPMQCGACGNGNLDKIFVQKEDAELYIKNTRCRRGVSWQIEERSVEVHYDESLVQ